jgi:hypothetical protein
MPAPITVWYRNTGLDGGAAMLESRIDLPASIPNMTPEAAQTFRDHVASADEILREEAAHLADHTVHAEWKLSPITAPPRVELILSLKPVRFTHQIFLEVLADPAKLRTRLRNELWYLVSTYAMNNQQEINRLLKEIKQDHALAGK